MTFIGIWFNNTTEVRRDYVEATDAADASTKLHQLYAGKAEPARCLTITPAGGYSKSTCEVN